MEIHLILPQSIYIKYDITKMLIKNKELKASTDWLEASGRHAATALVRLNIDFPTKARKPGKPQAPQSSGG